MPFHRLNDPTYPGGIPATHDRINDPGANGDAGSPALADGKFSRTGHPNDGTYFVPFQDDGTSETANRPHKALAENTDFLDDAVSGALAVPAEYDSTAGSDLSQLQLFEEVYTGDVGTYLNIQDHRDRIFKVLNSSTGSDLITSTGVKVQVSEVRESTGSTNAIGQSATGFTTSPILYFTPAIPSGSTYRIVYAKRSSLARAVRQEEAKDMLARAAVRGTHQVAAETQRFMLEAARRVGSIQALAATILETPGLGNNILGASNALTLDVNPDGTGVGDGELNVRFKRDTAPVTALSVREGSAPGESYWYSEEIIKFRDGSTEGGAAPDVPLSQATDGADQLRLVSSTPSGADATSVLKRLNAQHITVGNGTSTFGDFNGASAVQSALDYVAGLGVAGARILVKPGTYEFASGYTLPLASVTLVAASAGSCVLSVSTASGVPGIQVPADSKLELVDMGVVVTGTADLAIEVDPDGQLVMVGCEATAHFQLGAATTGNASVSFSSAFLRCTFSAIGGQASFSPLITIIPDVDVGLTFHQKFIFDQCSFLGGAYEPPVYLSASATGANVDECDGVVFRDCTFLVYAAPVTGAGPYEPDWNPGVLSINPALANGIIWNHILFENCTVRASAELGQGDPLLVSGSSLLDFTPPASMPVRHVELRGGLWTSRTQGTLVHNFYVGPPVWADDTNIRTVTVTDVSWGYFSVPGVPSFSTDTYGAARTNLAAGSDWAAFVLRADNVVMRNVRWTSCTGETGAGLLYLYYPKRMDVSGIDMTDWSDGDGEEGLNAFLVKIVGYYDGSSYVGTAGAFRGATIRKPVADANMNVGTQGIISVQPNGGVVVADCLVENFTNTGAIGISNAVLGAAVDTGSGLKVENCTVRNVQSQGVRASNATTGVVKDILVHGCTVSACEVGVSISGSGANVGVSATVTNNFIKDCSTYGVRVGNTLSDGEATVSVTNNYVSNCTLSEYYFADTGVNDTYALVIGNVAHNDGSPNGVGYLTIQTSDTSRGQYTTMTGVATSFDIDSGPTPDNFGAAEAFVDGSALRGIFNLAVVRVQA